MPKDSNAQEHKRTLILFRLGVRGRFQCVRSQRAWSCLDEWTSRAALPLPKKTNLSQDLNGPDLFRITVWVRRCPKALTQEVSSILQFISTTFAATHLCYTLGKRILAGVQSPAEDEWRYFCLLVFSCLLHVCCVTVTTQGDS